MRRIATLFLVLICLASGSASSPPEDLAKKFVGAWRLVSVEGNPPGRPGVYDRPTGLLMYDSSGHISVQIVVRADRKPFAPYTKGLLSATLDEKAAAFDSYAAYFGTYAVDAKAGTVTHHLENNLVPGRQGTDNVRRFEFPSRTLLSNCSGSASSSAEWEGGTS
jgi:Lipocalin-like domain